MKRYGASFNSTGATLATFYRFKASRFPSGSERVVRVRGGSWRGQASPESLSPPVTSDDFSPHRRPGGPSEERRDERTSWPY